MRTDIASRVARVAGGRWVGWAFLIGAVVALVLVAWIVSTPTSPQSESEPPPPLAEAVARMPPAPDVAALVDLLAAPQRYAEVTPADAVRRNALIPYAPGPVPSARSFLYPRSDPVAYARALGCMTAAIYYEAAGEPDAGQAAVAQVVLNRLRSPIYPHSVCGVVFQGAERSAGCQFTFACDGALARPPRPAGLARARAVAVAALSGRVAPTIGWATHYHAVGVLPLWAQTLLKTAGIGQHIFYRIPGALGAPATFERLALSAEPEVTALATLGLGSGEASAVPTAALPIDAVTSFAAPAAAPEGASLIGRGASTSPTPTADPDSDVSPSRRRREARQAQDRGYFAAPEQRRDHRLPM